MAQNFEQALTTELDTVTELTSRVYPMFASASKAAPYAAYTSNAGVPVRTMDGYAAAGGEVRGELNVVTSTYADLRTIVGKVTAKLASFEKRVIGTDGPFVQALTYMQPVEIYEALPKLHRCVIEFEVHI